MPPNPAPGEQDLRHSLPEDLYAILTGCMLYALGLVLMKAGGIATAGMGGVALLLSYLLPWGVGTLFFALNLPFLVLAVATLGRAFVLRTVAAILLITALVTLTREATAIAYVHPAFAALAGGTCCGVGMLVLIRHNTGIGGVNILALWAQKARGWNVGRLQMLLDGTIILAAAFALAPAQFGWSVLSVVAVNGILVASHKPWRYLGR